jgi:hypothetical protein
MFHIFHRWEKHYETEGGLYRGKPITCKWCELRRCRKCGVVQEYCYDSQGGSWSTLDGDRLDIITQEVECQANFFE